MNKNTINELKALQQEIFLFAKQLAEIAGQAPGDNQCTITLKNLQNEFKIETENTQQKLKEINQYQQIILQMKQKIENFKLQINELTYRTSKKSMYK
jgi:hypothetical protein